MITAEQIAKKLKLKVHIVRYRLSVLRQEKLIVFEQAGTTYIYNKLAIKEVRGFNKKGK